MRRSVMSRELWALESVDVSPTDQSALGGGFNLWIKDLEEVLSLHPAVRDCVVVEILHQDRGKDLFAFVTLRAELTGREQELRDWLRRRIDACRTLARIVILQELPKGSNGKVVRTALRDLAVSLETGIEVVG
jgi:acyl-coenzyme A synthetase/AMP-(fatty) acid ligase